MLTWLMGEITQTYMREVLHHELYHIIHVRQFGTLKDDGWAALNAPGFRYGNGGRWHRSPEEQREDSSVRGFVNRYSTSAVEEDQAEVYRYLMVDPNRLLRRSESDEILQRKVLRIKASLRSFCPAIDAAFWERMEKYQRKPRPVAPSQECTQTVVRVKEAAECLEAWSDGYAFLRTGDFEAAAKASEKALELATKAFGPAPFEHRDGSCKPSGVVPQFASLEQGGTPLSAKSCYPRGAVRSGRP